MRKLTHDDSFHFLPDNKNFSKERCFRRIKCYGN
nr:MAG TPA: hypothetical protein [Caudoviricetes sp.]